MFNSGMISAEVDPVPTQTAISTYSHSRPFCRTARGRDPLRAQTRVSVPCCPNLASSANQTSTRSAGRAAATAATDSGALF